MRWVGLVVAVIILFTAAGDAVTTHVCGSGLLQLLCDSNGNLMVNSGSGASAVTANQGTPASPSGAWPIQLVDSGGANVASVNASGQLSVVATQGTSPWVVTTPAPVATVTVLQGTSPWVVTTPAPVGTIGVIVQAACAASYPCGYPTPIPFPTVGAVLQAACVAAYPCGMPTPIPVATDSQGDQYAREGSSSPWSCFEQAITVLTQCEAAPGAGLKAYVTGIALTNQAATALTITVGYGTGTNCATTFTALTQAFQFGTSDLTTNAGANVTWGPATPLVPAAADEICVKPSAATAFGVTLTGFTGP